ncbi:transposase [Georgenia sp. EYE_87]|uniref:transposase n=1 Tax=Georgenia sp. EYE_87 TaxID=2853448 RepID=UPI00249DFA0A|nr:transposase [Georgenia sp. EYE_87]MCK6212117.1 transposase [Georgenia sp. EYE_87]
MTERPRKVYQTWLKDRGDESKAGVKVATLAPSAGTRTQTMPRLEDAAAVLDAFHVTSVDVIDEVRRRVQ